MEYNAANMGHGTGMWNTMSNGTRKLCWRSIYTKKESKAVEEANV